MSPFVLVHNPIRWTVIAGHLVPGLHKTTLEPGVNRVEMRLAKGRVQICRGPHQAQRRRPHLVIPYEWGPDGESYVQVVETRPNGRAGRPRDLPLRLGDGGAG
jgi:hypothetical protein